MFYILINNGYLYNNIASKDNYFLNILFDIFEKNNLQVNSCLYNECCKNIPCKKGCFFQIHNNPLIDLIYNKDDKYLIIYENNLVEKMEKCFLNDKNNELNYKNILEFIKLNKNFYKNFTDKWLKIKYSNIYLLDITTIENNYNQKIQNIFNFFYPNHYLKKSVINPIFKKYYNALSYYNSQKINWIIQINNLNQNNILENELKENDELITTLEEKNILESDDLITTLEENNILENELKENNDLTTTLEENNILENELKENDDLTTTLEENNILENELKENKDLENEIEENNKINNIFVQNNLIKKKYEVTLIKEKMSSIYDEETEVNNEIKIENTQETIVKTNDEQVKENGKKNKKGKGKNNKKQNAKPNISDEKKKRIRKAIHGHLERLHVDMFASRHKKEKIKARALGHMIKKLKGQLKSL